MDTTPVILRPAKAKTILLAVVSLLFVSAGIMMINDGRHTGWFVALFFGLCFLVFMLQLVPGASQLTLTSEGFITTSLFRSHITKWADVKAFEVGYIGRKKTVMFNFVDSHSHHVIGKGIAGQLTGFHGGLPDTYGLKVTELRDLLNEWKKKSEQARDI